MTLQRIKDIQFATLYPMSQSVYRALVEVRDETAQEYNAKFQTALKLLRTLADLQNGSPLVTYEKEWQRTMDNIYAFLNEHESKISA